MNQPKVSILIPTYNQAPVIYKAIESALAQDYQNLEIIISDDCSFDNTAGVVRKYIKDDRVKYYGNNYNLGRVKNYHKTLYERSTGDWVINLDGDDYFNDEFVISDIVNLLNQFEDKNILFVQGGRIMKGADGKETPQLPPIINDFSLLTGFEFFNNFSKTLYFSHMSTLYKRDMALKFNFYSKDMISADVESFLRLAIGTNGNMVYVKRIFGVWNVHETNASHIVSHKEKLKNLLYLEDVANSNSPVIVSPNELKKWKYNLRILYFLDWLYKVLMNESQDRLFEYTKLLKFIFKYDHSMVFSIKFMYYNFIFILKRIFKKSKLNKILEIY